MNWPPIKRVQMDMYSLSYILDLEEQGIYTAYNKIRG